MIYRIIYDQPEATRVIQAVLIDERASIPDIKNKTGAVVKQFVDVQAAMVNDDTLFYKIETGDGNLAGYFSLRVIRTGVVSLLQYELRPAFQQFDSVIQSEINNFMSSGAWQNDAL